MAKRIEMITQAGFFGHIFRSVRGIFVFFDARKFKEVIEELEDLGQFVELNYDKVCDWGYPCSYVPYRVSLIPASNKDILKEILEISQILSEYQDENIDVSQHLWRLMEGWETSCILELFWSRMGLKPIVGYGKADINSRVERAKKISHLVK